MTQKRFSMKGSTILECGEEITAWDCCDLLNELHEENEEIGNTLDNMVTFKNKYKDRYRKLKEENEQLKQAYTQLEHRHSLLHDECIDAECDRDSYRKDIVSLEKENEQLKSEINMLKTTIGRNEGYIDRLTHQGEWR